LLNTDLLTEFNKTASKNAIPVFAIAANEIETPGIIPEGLPEPIQALARANGFAGSPGNVIAASQGVLIGMGDGADPFLLAAAAEKLPSGTYQLARQPESLSKELLSLGWLLGCYRFDRYKRQTEPGAKLIAPEGIDRAVIISAAEATSYVRDLVNTPASDMLPHHLEEATRSLSKAHGASLSVISGENLLTENFPMVHAVGRASISEPRLLDLRWSPDGNTNDLPKITLVGKGVCFDSGGLNIKGGSGMALMKKDMGGAANALGLAQMIMKANLPINLRVLISAVENAIDGSAFRPSDILQSRKGLTVEIGNTDAEGRLVLGDALTYGGEEKPDLMISLATLTGAARVALGPEIIPYYCDDTNLSIALAKAGEEQFDPAWPMPLWQRYQSQLSSPVADLNNISGNSFAGSIIAALFLQRFVPRGVPWMHFDLYAWRPSSEPGRPKGGEAQCIRALFAMIEKQFVG